MGAAPLLIPGSFPSEHIPDSQPETEGSINNCSSNELIPAAPKQGKDCLAHLGRTQGSRGDSAPKGGFYPGFYREIFEEIALEQGWDKGAANALLTGRGAGLVLVCFGLFRFVSVCFGLLWFVVIVDSFLLQTAAEDVQGGGSELEMLLRHWELPAPNKPIYVPFLQPCREKNPGFWCDLSAEFQILGPF